MLNRGQYNIPAPANPSANVGGNGGSTEYRYKVASVGPTDEESLASAEAVVADAAATLTSSARVELAWDAVEGATHYRVYRAVNGVYGFVGKAVEAAYTDEGDRSPDLDDTPPELRRPFQEPGDYPSCVQFFEQRLMWAASENDPQRIWGSQTVHYHNHNVSTPLRDDDALSYTIVADRVNAVRWMMPGKRRLLFGTAGGEWTMAGANGDPLTPLSVETSRETVRGSAALPPVTAGSTVLFAQRPGNVAREFRYSLEEDGFAATDVSILSEHVLGPSRIRDWAYQQSPASIVWIAREDGALAGLTYLREHKVVGWHRHATDGRVVSLASIPGPESGPGQAEDEVWLCVEREADGVKRHAVERLTPLFSGEHAETAFFVDAGLSLDAWNDDQAATLTLTPDDPDGAAGTPADLTAEGFAPFESMAVGDRYRLRAPLPQPWAGGAADRDTACEVELTEVVSPTHARARLRTNLPERLNGAATPHHAAPVTRLYGLDHLQGRRVQVLADGTVRPEVVVGDASSAPWATYEWGAGEIELPRPAALVHAGLGYVSDLSPMKPELPDGLGPSQGRIKRVALGAVRLHKSLGLKAGSGEDSLERVPFEDERMGAAAPLFSGDKAISLEAEPSPDAALLLRQDLPLPCTVLAVMLKLEVMAP